MAVWEDYDRWNLAVAEVVYTGELAGQPSYLDLEDDVLEKIAGVSEPGCTDAEARLIEVVRATLSLDDGPAAVLKAHWRRLERWWGGDSFDPPPVLALLAVLSLTAENMAQGEGMAANNYYGRLGLLLGLDDEQIERFTTAYRQVKDGHPVSEWLWGSLNSWLELLEGNRGLPTAFADGHLTHIGLPLSQAILRDADRQKLPDFFAHFGLAPRSSLQPPEMASLFEGWVTRDPCPVSRGLRQFWEADDSSRDRIADVLSQMLSAWDGSGVSERAHASGATAGIGGLRIALGLTSFPSKRADIGMLVSRGSRSDGETFTVLNGEGSRLASIPMAPASAGWLAPADPTSIDVASLLRAHAILEPESGGSPVERKGRRLIPLRQDPTLMMFVEVERAGLGDDMVLLCSDDILQRAKDLLATAARPGWRVQEGLVGVPSGWSLIDGVQIISSISAETMKRTLVDLNCLQPISKAQVGLEGGMRLPGNIQKFSTFRPPELRVTTEDAGGIAATATVKRALVSPTPSDVGAESDVAVLIWDLASADLPDGDYEISIDDGSGKLHTKTLRLRSADNPALQLDDESEILRSPEGAAWSVISAAEVDDDSWFEVAPEVSTRDAAPAAEQADRIIPRWWGARQQRPERNVAGSTIEFPAPDPGSCIVTGAHHMDYPPVMPGPTSSGTIEGVCRGCGTVKRSPSTAWAAKKRKANGGKSVRLAPSIDVDALEPVRESSDVDWKVALDAVFHVGKGRISALETIAHQIQPGGLFADILTRSLEDAGHIEVERDPSTLHPTRWMATRPTLLELADGSYAWIGFRSESLQVALEDACFARRAEFTVVESPEMWPHITIKAQAGDSIDLIASDASATSSREFAIVRGGALALARCLPSFSVVADLLPATSGVSGRKVERWDPERAEFTSVADAGAPGAFRISEFGRSYIYRRPEDVGVSRALVTDARIGKHLASIEAGHPLVGYDPDAEVLYVPMGAELPGLFARAAVLASGKPPRRNVTDGLSEYRMVGPELAAVIVAKMSS